VELQERRLSGGFGRVNETEVVQTFGAACNEDDRSRREALLEKSMTEAASFVGPLGEHVGRQAVSDLIGRYRRRSPDVSFVIASAVDAHHGMMRFRWQVKGPDGRLVSSGFKFAEQAEDGRLARVVSFFGPVPGLGEAAGT
jgi:hypothetical protein